MFSNSLPPSGGQAPVPKQDSTAMYAWSGTKRRQIITWSIQSWVCHGEEAHKILLSLLRRRDEEPSYSLFAMHPFMRLSRHDIGIIPPSLKDSLQQLLRQERLPNPAYMHPRHTIWFFRVCSF
jgi:hypothetical protein